MPREIYQRGVVMNLDSIMETYTKAQLVEMLVSDERKESELNRKNKDELAELYLSLNEATEAQNEPQTGHSVPKSELY